jgi:hypothetical protein
MLVAKAPAPHRGSVDVKQSRGDLRAPTGGTRPRQTPIAGLTTKDSADPEPAALAARCKIDAGTTPSQPQKKKIVGETHKRAGEHDQGWYCLGSRRLRTYLTACRSYGACYHVEVRQGHRWSKESCADCAGHSGSRRPRGGLV